MLRAVARPARALMIAAIVLTTVTATMVISSGGNDTGKAEPNITSTETVEAATTAVQSALPETQDGESAAPLLPGQYPITDEEIVMLAKLIWGEARGVQSVTQKAAVVWCVLNRVDAYEFPDTIAEVILQKKQFVGYAEDFPATEVNIKIATDVINRWNAEKASAVDVGRVLPSDYKWFTGDGKYNYFTNDWPSGETWDWSIKAHTSTSQQRSNSAT